MLLQNQIRAWLILLAVSVLALWLLRSILLPFVAGMALAYLLDPVADRLQKWRFSRFWATVLILFVAVMFFVGAFFLVVPLVVQQIAGLAARLPGYVIQLQELANRWAPAVYEWVGEERAVQVQNSFAELLTRGVDFAGVLTGQIMQSGSTIINALALMVITPVVAFYLLLDWDGMVAQVYKLLPRDHQTEIAAVFADIDRAMAGVIRGQVSVVLLLALFYATALTFAGLSFGLAIGLIAGLLSFVPYVGFLVGFILSVGVALVQFWPDGVMIGIIVAIFAVGQFLEGNVLYPKLVGSSIGVHPVWLMFALFAFGLIFGFVGLLLAVPMAAIAGVLARFAVAKYKSSSLYLGTGGGGADDSSPAP